MTTNLTIHQGEAEVIILSSADIAGELNSDLDNFTMSVALSRQASSSFRRDCCDIRRECGYLEWRNVSAENGIASIDITAEQSSKLPVGVYTLAIKFNANDAIKGVVYREIKDYIEVKPSIFK